MINCENVGSFDALRREVIRRGILSLQKKELRDLLGKRKSGRHVNNSIRHELQRRGIVHFPKEIPMSQLDIVVLTMTGSPGVRQLERLFNAAQEELNRVFRQGPAPGTESWPSVERGVSVSDRLPAQKRVCGECGQEYSVEELLAACPGFWDHPYNYSHAAVRCCLACWLGVGPKDIAEMMAGKAEMTAGMPTPSTAQWLQTQVVERGLKAHQLAERVGVHVRTVKNWLRNGLPRHGTGARMVKETFEKMSRESGAYSD